MIRILSLDGGGVRGIIAGQIIIALQQKLRDKIPNQQANIIDYFDLIAGTSTGAILACIYLCPDSDNLTMPKYAVEDAVQFYKEEANNIFNVSPWQWLKSLGGVADEKYDTQVLELVLKNYFRDVKLSQLLKPCLITSYDIEARHAKFFTKPETPQDPDFLVRDVLRATTAVPAHFEVAKVEPVVNNVYYPLIDGGLFANNPAMCAYAEVRAQFPQNPTAQDMAILSIGTGKNYCSYDYDKAKGWGYIEWLRPIYDIISAGVSETVDYQLRQLFDAVGRPNQYLRVDTDIQKASLAFDCATPENLGKLEEEGGDWAVLFDADLTNFVDNLLP